MVQKRYECGWVPDGWEHVSSRGFICADEVWCIFGVRHDSEDVDKALVTVSTKDFVGSLMIRRGWKGIPLWWCDRESLVEHTCDLLDRDFPGCTKLYVKVEEVRDD